MKVTLFSKTMTQIAVRAFDVEVPPRVGEIIDLSEQPVCKPADKEVNTFFVFEVVWEIDGTYLVPHAKCMQWLEGDRRAALQEQGWI